MLVVAALISAALAQSSPNLVIITMDTTRADALGCYGRQLPGIIEPRVGVSPNIDAIAARGVRFDAFYAHAPTTLNSHTSLMTGRDPHEHAVPRNGFPVPEGIPTLAERLKSQGYDTIAVVAAAALAADMGLSRGFDLYDDRMSTKKGPMYQDVAEGVVARVQAAVAARRSDAPLFLWVHLYDPHGPYSAPGEWFGTFTSPSYTGPYASADEPLALRRPLRNGTADPADIDQIAARYLSEVHYMDHHIGRMLDDLGERGLMEHSLLVLTADHGETLSEQPTLAWSHGGDVDHGVVHIPLIVAGSGVPVAAGAVVHTQLDMSGLAPTLEQLLGLPATLVPGGSFAHLVRPGPVWDADGWPSRPTRVTFSEATRTRNEPTTGWNNFGLPRSVRVGDVGARQGGTVTALQPVDDRELPPNAGNSRSLLEDLLRDWDLRAPPHREPDLSEETLDALRSLGYIDGPSEDLPGDDPRSTPP